MKSTPLIPTHTAYSEWESFRSDMDSPLVPFKLQLNVNVLKPQREQNMF